MNVLGVAFLGVGRMGETHLRNLRSLDAIKVISVADPNLEAAEAGRRLAGAEHAFTGPEEAIDQSGVDAVIIVTPTDTHARLIELAARKRKAIFSEKPIALDLAETARVIEVIRETEALVQLGFMRRFDPGYAEAKARIDRQELGRLETFRALSRDTYPPSVEFLRRSGGLFLDMAIHDFDLARFLVGEVEQVSAWGSVLIDKRFEQAGDIDTAVTQLRFRNGVLGVVETSRRSAWGYDIRTEIAGSKAKLVIESPQRTPVRLSQDFRGSYDHFENFPDRFEAAYRLELKAFFDAVRKQENPSPGPADALESLRLGLAAKRSWRENRPVRIEEIRPETAL